MRAQKGNVSKPSACHGTHYIEYETHLFYSSVPGSLIFIATKQTLMNQFNSLTY